MKTYSTYKQIYNPEHPRASSAGNINEHTIVAEKALGKMLPNGAQIHHIDENTRNNNNTNLVICPNAAYHKLLHIRSRALRGCGNPNFRSCTICKKWDNPSYMRLKYSGPCRSEQYIHRACHAERERILRPGRI